MSLVARKRFSTIECDARKRRAEVRGGTETEGRVVSALLATFTLCLFAAATPADPLLSVFDAHVHYNRVDWARYPPARVLKLWDENAVAAALVSSTPDDGTRKLHELAPARVIAFLRPYRSPADRANWFANAEVLAYIERRLRHGIYRGIGEFHLFDGQSGTPQIKRLVGLAVENDIVLYAHSDPATVRALYAINPQVKILWAHAGMDTTVQTIGDMLERYPTLMAELSVRQRHIAPGGRLDSRWRALFLRLPQRFMIGVDTARAARWDSYAQLLNEHRRWLAQLPRDVSEKIAHGNAERYFVIHAASK